MYIGCFFFCTYSHLFALYLNDILGLEIKIEQFQTTFKQSLLPEPKPGLPIGL